ncbi:MAG: hypothetical protein KI790_12025 [Cyclobacteriaceae bacterium]|nr:hypothetical protein [Cyclobacteriaceae bacterium HetDA_MAG_MS6]
MKFLGIALCGAILLMVHFSASAQGTKVYEFDLMEDRLDESSINEQLVKPHYMGPDIANKMYLLKESYTWMSPPSPSSPTEKLMIEKPSIYSSVRKLSSHYKKMIKKGNIEKGEAKEVLAKALDIALSIRFQQTVDLELKLQGIKSADEIAVVFADKVVLN